MPRYFFQIEDDAAAPQARVGVDLPDLESARAEAIRFSCEKLGELDGFWKTGDWRVSISDPTGLILFTLAFCGWDAPVIRSSSNQN
jgi:hypothetical protein